MPSPPAESSARSPGTAAFTAAPAVLAFVLAGIFLWRSTSVSGPEGTYPVLLAVGVLLVGGINLLRDLLQPAPADRAEVVAPDRNAVRRLVAFVVVLVAAVVLLEPAGFFPAMVVMVLGALLCFDVRSPWVLAAGVALMVGVSYLIFVRLLAVPFPPGFLGLT